ncbi:MAG TPA: Z1 domain-containing protein [Solirubrobacterales bacterium]
MSVGTDSLFQIYAAALGGMGPAGPSDLLRRAKFEAEGLDAADLADPSVLTARLSGAQAGEKLLTRFRLTLSGWDAESMAVWIGETAPNTETRRARIYELLKLDDDLIACFDSTIPLARNDSVVISEEFEPWYPRVMSEREPFYWKHYAEYLASEWDSESSVAALDLNTTRIVERLSDPERKDAYQAKGLVVGYVQSGKTANFTGVVAKAIDAGYRLVIILTGQTDLLRGQTQRRIDKELIGHENLMRGIDEDDLDAVQSVDYHGAPDRDEFVRHGALPSALGFSDVYRLTTKAGDYKSLAQGISSLDFERLDPDKPLNDPVNLHRIPTRIAIVKKNKSVLTKLVKDLKRITAKLEDIPALIIDDESDQASLNTTNPKKWEKDRKTRTAINGLISELLGKLPRGQYIGYTATPFANVFVDPSDAVDLFPKSFILSLDRPPGYMGAAQFHDLDVPPEDEVRTPANSNRLAYVREIEDEGVGDEMQQALDLFVLTGAIKLYREKAEKGRRFKHHTMLIHESVKQADHRELADDVREMWEGSGYWGASGRVRLEDLFHSDVAEVMEARHGEAEVPVEFDAIKPYVGTAVTKIEGSQNDPVLIVNGDKEAAKEEVDFDSRPVWRILVGGAKLSRGFTVEGLTVSYYRRVTKQADTLMQMGRWFGFRSGYKDLVRLYIDRGGPEAKFDLYEAFEAACLSEELFRDEIRKYAEVEKDGIPVFTPKDVPPLVSQHLGWLKPAATSKMYNAQLVERRSPGERLEPTGYPDDPAEIAQNTESIAPLFAAASNDGAFQLESGSQLPARHGLIDHSTLVEVLKRLSWRPEDHFTPDLVWLEGLKDDQIKDWAVLWPQHVGAGPKSTIEGFGTLSVFRRRRRKGRGGLFGAISDPKHRPVADQIAGVGDHDDALARELSKEHRGAVLIYPMVEAESNDEIDDELGVEDVIMALVFVAPLSTGSPDGTLVRFVARDETRPDDVIIDSPS